MDDRRQRGVLQPGQMALEQVGHFGSALEPLRGLLPVEALDDLDQPARNLGGPDLDRGRRVVADATDHLDGRLSGEGRSPGAHGVQDAAEAEQVGPTIHRLAPGLLGGHVLRRAGQGAMLGQLGVVDGPGQAEVGQLDPRQVVLQHNVARLDIAVDQPLRVRGGQAGGDLRADAEDLRDLQGSAFVDPLLGR